MLMKKSLKERLAILSDAAKYDASCASSGTVKRDSSATGGLGSTEGSGICHAYAPDGRTLFVTVHPSYLLRIPDEGRKAEELARFRQDMSRIKRLAA